MLLFFLLLRFAIRYRAGNTSADRDHRIKKSWHWEIGWTAATLVAFLGLFVWGAQLYLDLYARAAGRAADLRRRQAMDVEGRSISAVSARSTSCTSRSASAVRLIMASQDVIHCFFMPAFRIKHDVVPGTIEELWFRPRKPGVFHLFCAEYCGTDHSRMTGRIVVMEQAGFEQWLARQDVDRHAGGGRREPVPAARLQRLPRHWRAVRAPPLEGLYGKPVPLSDGTIADRRRALSPRFHPAAALADRRRL